MKSHQLYTFGVSTSKCSRNHKWLAVSRMPTESVQSLHYTIYYVSDHTLKSNISNCARETPHH